MGQAADSLSPKQRVFVEEYLRTWNASEASRRAGYKSRANAQGSRMLANDGVAAAIRERIAEKAMGADEVLLRLADQARGDMADFTAVRGGRVVADLPAARAGGKFALVKELEQDGDGGMRVKLYDAQAALVQLGRHHKLFTDRTEGDVPGLDNLIDASLDRKLAGFRARLADSGAPVGPDRRGEDGA